MCFFNAVVKGGIVGDYESMNLVFAYVNGSSSSSSSSLNEFPEVMSSTGFKSGNTATTSLARRVSLDDDDLSLILSSPCQYYNTPLHENIEPTLSMMKRMFHF